MDQIRVKEIFYSIQGEAATQGLPTVFVRLSGCPLRCTYCDSAYAFSGGRMMSVEDIITEVQDYPARYVTVTGGEPLAQPSCIALLSALCDLDYQVSLETSGALTVADVDPRVRKVVDFKVPSSGEVSKNHWNNVNYLLPSDELKFVVGDRDDFDWALLQIEQQALIDRVASIWVSPVYQQLDPSVLADWVLSSGLPIRIQMQLHKLLWGDAPGR